MALTASDLVTAARQRTFGQRGPQKVSDAALVEELNYQDTLITQMFSQIAPGLLTTLQDSVSITLSDNKSGYTLSAGIHYRDFTHVDTSDDEYEPINIVGRHDRHSRPSPPAGIVQLSGNTGVFYPIDPQNDRWQSSDARTWFEETESHELAYSYVPEPGNLSALSDTLTSPDMAREVLVESLVLSILLSNPRVGEAQVQVALSKRQGMVDSLRLQALKFVHPQGQEGGRGDGTSDAGWVAREVGG